MTVRFALFVLLAIFLFGCNPSSLDWTELEVVDMNEQPVDLSKYKGKKIFLNFWATWCGPCLAEMPAMEKARQELSGDDYVFIVVSDEPLERINAYRKAKGYQFEYLKLASSIKTAGIFSIPQTYLIDRKGEIVQAINGGVNWASTENMNLLRAIE